MREELDKKYGAEHYGVEPVFTETKWKNTECKDWEIDQQYIDDMLNPAVNWQYFDEDIEYAERAATLKKCIDCLWNDGDHCCHPKAEAITEGLTQ